MPAPDPDLAAFARSGCADAFRRLVERHVDAVHSTASRLLWGWPADAADVTQSVFILLARKAPRLSPELVVGAWLHRQTVRHALNARRTETRRAARERTAADLLAMNATACSDPAAALRPHIDAAILALPEREREMLVLHYFEDQPQREIAARLGLSANAVQKRLTRALERVRRHLERRGAAVTAVALAAWFSGSSVQAAPASLAASIAAQALPHAAAGTGFLTTLITVMTHTKALTAGTAAGLIMGGLCAVWPQDADARVSSSTAPAAGLRDLAGRSRPAGGEASRNLLVPRAEATAEELVAQLQEIISQPDNERTRILLAAWLEQVPVTAWPEFAKLAHERLRSDLRDRWMPDLARQWARIAPVEAVTGLAALSEIGISFVLGDNAPSFPTSLAGDAFTEWHKADAAAAQQWMVEHQEDAGIAKCLPKFVATVAEALMEKSPESLVRWAFQLQGDDLRDAAAQVFRHKTHDMSEDAAVALLEMLRTTLPALGDEAFGRKLSVEFLAGLRGNNPLLSHLNQWMDSLPAGPGREMISQASFQAAVETLDNRRLTRESLAALSDQQAAAVLRRSILGERRIGILAHEWMLPLITGPDRDAVLMQGARRIVPSYGGNYLTEDGPSHGQAIIWAAAVSDPAVRDPLVYGLYSEMLLAYHNNHWEITRSDGWLAEQKFPPEIMAIMDRAKQDFTPRK